MCRHFAELKIVFNGVGASGVATSKIFMDVGVRNIIGCDTAGAIYKGRTENMNFMKEWYAEHTNPEGEKGSLAQVIEGAEAQYTQAFENLKAVLAAAGATLENVVDLVTYHTDMRDIMRFIEVKNRYFTKDYPAWTAIGVSALAMPGLLVEIKATAVL